MKAADTTPASAIGGMVSSLRTPPAHRVQPLPQPHQSQDHHHPQKQHHKPHLTRPQVSSDLEREFNLSAPPSIQNKLLASFYSQVRSSVPGSLSPERVKVLHDQISVAKDTPLDVFVGLAEHYSALMLWDLCDKCLKEYYSREPPSDIWRARACLVQGTSPKSLHFASCYEHCKHPNSCDFCGIFYPLWQFGIRSQMTDLGDSLYMVPI